MHQLTRTDKYELLVVAINVQGAMRIARHDRFAVGSEYNHYPLTIGKYVSGSLNKNFETHNGTIFTTADTDPDCATKNGAGWWYKDCHNV